MANTIPPAVYQRMGLQQARLKSMPRGKFIQWITDFYNDAYKTGWNECMDRYNAEHGGISISEDIDAAVILDMDFVPTIIAVMLGVLLAGVIMMTASVIGFSMI